MNKHITLTLLFLLISIFSFGQRNRNAGFFTEIHLTQGGVIKSNDFVRGENKEGKTIDNFSSTDLRFGWQTQGNELWHHDLQLPYFGLGLYNIVFSNEDEIGYPSAVYFFFGSPFARYKNSSLDYEFSFGLSYNWKPYDDINNPFNVAIGSYKNAYIDAQIKYVWYMSKRFTLDAGLRLTHFSNGAIRLPNKGINLIAPSLGIRYDIVPKTPYPFDEVKDQKRTISNELSFLFSSGKRSVRGTTTPNEHMASLFNVSVDYLIPTNNIFKYGFGLDFGLDESRNLLIDGNDITHPSITKQLFSGASVIGQFRAYRLGVQAGIGYEFFNDGKIYFTNQLYQRLGLRYYVYKDFFAGINIKARNFSVANYVEWNIGYTIPFEQR